MKLLPGKLPNQTGQFQLEQGRDDLRRRGPVQRSLPGGPEPIGASGCRRFRIARAALHPVRMLKDDCVGLRFRIHSSFRFNRLRHRSTSLRRSSAFSSTTTSFHSWTSFAPCLISRFGPQLIFEVMFPGTAKTSRFCSAASLAVIAEPEYSPPFDHQDPSAHPADDPVADRESSADRAACPWEIRRRSAHPWRSARPACGSRPDRPRRRRSRTRRSSRRPPDLEHRPMRRRIDAPRHAADDGQPGAARSLARRAATAVPYAVGRRVPTIPSISSPSSSTRPRANSSGGGSKISLSRARIARIGEAGPRTAPASASFCCCVTASSKAQPLAMLCARPGGQARRFQLRARGAEHGLRGLEGLDQLDRPCAFPSPGVMRSASQYSSSSLLRDCANAETPEEPM